MGDVSQYLALNGGIVSTTQYSKESHNSSWHSHENLHFCFVFQGGGRSKSACRLNTEISDNLFFYPAGAKHIWIPNHGLSKSVNIEIGNRFFKAFDSNEERIGHSLKENPDAKFLMLKMRRELLSFDRNSECSIQTLLLELVNLPASIGGSEPPQWVRKVTEFIHDEWQRSFSLDCLSQSAGVHPVTISKYFRKYFSCTLGEYLRKLKIEKSLSLIKNTTRSLTDIALSCGFSDQSHFTRTFKQLLGFLPNEFRKT